MLIVMDIHAGPEQIEAVCSEIRALGLSPHPMPGAQRTAIGITGNKSVVDAGRFEAMPGVMRVIHVTAPYKLVSREFHEADTVVPVGDVRIGTDRFTVMAGPCAVESAAQIDTVAARIKQGGGHILRGGAFKPRTSPYSFQGLAEEGLRLLAEAGRRHGLPVVTEAIDGESLDLVARYADMVQIGARNMQNFSLLRKAGRCGRPVLLKRGMAATLEELLMAAEYIVSEGNPNVVLCERGVRTFADHTRNTLDLSAVPFVQRTSHLPIIVDPSHGTGKRHKVTPLSCAAVAVGAHGLMVEVHPNPDTALSDGPQSIDPDQFDNLMKQVGAIARVVGRSLS
ncbi:MAG: 3-deoxy-7-phosphoheptulonate synthase [candidate division Zixibacteria bacterium]|nr:3-deoxy-7-phosphoheptulonate synthase [candidate division Zixibacteria bacterium]